MKVYWQDVVRVHRANPTWTSDLIAAELGCCTGYVRATAARRNLPIPRLRHAKRHAQVKVPVSQVLPFCKAEESPHAALERIVRDALERARAA